MGIQFLVGLRTKRNRRNHSGDSRYSGPAGQNIIDVRIGRRQNNRLEFALQTVCFFEPLCQLRFEC